jgi:hypothetical protein
MGRSGGLVLVASIAVVAWACGSSGGTPADAVGDTGVPEAGATETGAALDSGSDASTTSDANDGAAQGADDTLSANRDRLLTTYLAYLKATPGAQSNGLDGAKLTGVCDLWKTLVPSAQGVYLTLTARLQGSKVTKDGASMLSHALKLYRIAGGDGATATDPGMCGGDGNRVFLSMDPPLHDALIAASTNKGQPVTGGKSDIEDVQIGANSFWRDSHDLGGAHAPFDISDETDNGAPRGQVQYFKDVTSAAAKAALGRTDLMTLIDPYALEVDQDYDCPHNSNPLCAYTTYGSLCFPAASKLGTELYTEKYGAFDPTWKPVDCAGK